MADRTQAKVTVVIPSHNAGHFLGEALESLFNQTYHDWQAVVVDDGSSDDTAQVVKPFLSSKVLYVRQSHQGVAVARNHGVQLTCSPYVGFLDADDTLMPWALQEQVAVLDAHPQVGLVFGQVHMVDESGKAHGKREAFPSDKLLICPSQDAVEGILKRNFITTSSVMMRRSCFEEAGGFDPELKTTGEDWMLFLRVACKASLAYIPRPLARYRVHPDSLTARAPVTPEAAAARRHVLERFFAQEEVRQKFGSLEKVGYAYLYYRFALLAGARGMVRPSALYFAKAIRFSPRQWLSADGLTFAYVFGKALLPRPLIRMARRVRQWVTGDQGLHHGIYWEFKAPKESHSRWS